MASRSTIASFQVSGSLNVPRTRTVLPTAAIQVVETPASILSNLTSMGEQISPSDVQRLEAATFKDGKRIFTLDQRQYFYEWAALLHDIPVIDVLDYLTSAQNAVSAFWDMPTFNKARKDLEREILMMKEPEVGVRGIAKCGRCTSDNLVFSMSQTRAADEGFSVHYRCADCGNRWTG